MKVENLACNLSSPCTLEINLPAKFAGLREETESSTTLLTMQAPPIPLGIHSPFRKGDARGI